MPHFADNLTPHVMLAFALDAAVAVSWYDTLLFHEDVLKAVEIQNVYYQFFRPAGIDYTVLIVFFLVEDNKTRAASIPYSEAGSKAA